MKKAFSAVVLLLATVLAAASNEAEELIYNALGKNGKERAAMLIDAAALDTDDPRTALNLLNNTVLRGKDLTETIKKYDALWKKYPHQPDIILCGLELFLKVPGGLQKARENIFSSDKYYYSTDRKDNRIDDIKRTRLGMHVFAVDHANLGDGGVTLFLIAEIALEEKGILKVHSKTLILNELGKCRAVKGDKAAKRLNLGRDGIVDSQRLKGIKRRFPRFHGVDDVLFDLLYVLGGQLAFKEINTRGAYGRTLTAGNDLNTLCGRVSALVKLPRKVLDSKNRGKVTLGNFLGYNVKLRLGKHRARDGAEQLLADVLHVIAVQKTDATKPLNAKKQGKVGINAGCLVGKLRLFFYVDAINHM